MMKVEFESNVNESKNLLDFGFAKICHNPTTFGFGVELVTFLLLIDDVHPLHFSQLDF